MQRTKLATALGALIVCLAAIDLTNRSGHAAGSQSPPKQANSRLLHADTLCAKDERVIFACVLRRPAKIVSICASKVLTRKTGYLQYRFGLPRNIELEFPRDRAGTQDKFDYTHYMRALVDLNEINFTVDGVNYSLIDDYNGEEKPAQSIEGMTIDWPGTNRKEVRYTCRTRPKTDYTDLQAVLSAGSD